MPIIDIEDDDPPRPPRDSTWAREVTSISGIRVDADPFAIAKGDLIKCLLLRDSVVADASIQRPSRSPYIDNACMYDGR